jgi:hypothetical protein
MDAQWVEIQTLQFLSHVSAISTTFMCGFSSSLIASLGIAFTQRIWHLFHIKPLTASTI